MPESGFGPWQNGIEFPSVCSFIDLQLFSPGLRQQKYSQDHDKVGGRGKRGDGVSQGNAHAEVADESRRQRADAASELQENPWPNPRNRLGNSSVKNATGLNDPDAKKPSGNPSTSMTGLLMGR
jgi:hypothetical protein